MGAYAIELLALAFAVAILPLSSAFELQTHHTISATPPPDEPDFSWIGGCALYIVGSVIVNFGHTVIRLSHVTSSREVGSRSWKGTALWVAGFALFSGGDVINMVGLNFAAQSLLEALGSVQFISNLFFSVFLLGERLKRRHVASTLLIVLGNILIVAWGDHKRQKITLTLVTKLISSTTFMVYMSLVYPLALTIGVLEYCSRKEMSSRRGGLGAAAFALSSAMIGANSVMVIKALSGLIHTYLSDDSPEKKPPTDRLVLTLVLAGVLAGLHILFWVTRLNGALRRYEALFIIPVLQASWITFTVLSGGIFFGEFSSLSPHQVFGFSSGLAVVIVGVLVLVPPVSQTGRGGRVTSRRQEVGELPDRGFERGFLQARALLEAGELDNEEYDAMLRILTRSWRTHRNEIMRRMQREEEVGSEDGGWDSAPTWGWSFGAVYDRMQEWLEADLAGGVRAGEGRGEGGLEETQTLGNNGIEDVPTHPLLAGHTQF